MKSFGIQLKIRRNKSPPSSWSNNKQSKKPTWKQVETELHVPPKHRLAFSGLHGFISQKVIDVSFTLNSENETFLSVKVTENRKYSPQERVSYMRVYVYSSEWTYRHSEQIATINCCQQLVWAQHTSLVSYCRTEVVRSGQTDTVYTPEDGGTRFFRNETVSKHIPEYRPLSQKTTIFIVPPWETRIIYDTFFSDCYLFVVQNFADPV
jgi:hypothetical protein